VEDNRTYKIKMNNESVKSTGQEMRGGIPVKLSPGKSEITCIIREK